MADKRFNAAGMKAKEAAKKIKPDTLACEHGNWVSAQALEEENLERMKKGEKFRRLHYGDYKDEHDKLKLLKLRAAADFDYYQQVSIFSPKRGSRRLSITGHGDVDHENEGSCGEEGNL